MSDRDLKATILFAVRHRDESKRHNAQMRFLNDEAIVTMLDGMSDADVEAVYARMLDDASPAGEIVAPLGRAR
jgi:hypothetical protein